MNSFLHSGFCSLIVASLTGAFTCSAVAADRPYVSVKVGRTALNLEDTIVFASQSAIDIGNSITTWSVAAGYRFESVFDIEVAYTDFGSTSFVETQHTSHSVVGIVNVANGSLEAQGIRLVLIKPWSLGRWEVFGELGADYTTWKVSGTMDQTATFLSIPTFSRSRFDNDPVRETTVLLGAGVGYTLTNHLFIQLEVSALPTGVKLTDWVRNNREFKPISAGIGLQYRF